MNDARKTSPEEEQQDEVPDRGPNLTLIYSLIVFAMLAAVAFAALIVLPFYRHR